MNKKLEKFAAEHGMLCSGGCLYGTYNGCQVSVQSGSTWLSAMFVVGFHVCLGSEAGEFFAWLGSQKKHLHIGQVKEGRCGFFCTFPNMTLSGSLKKIHALLDAVTGRLAALGIGGEKCPYCGEILGEDRIVEEGGCLFRAHEHCFEERLAQVKDIEAAEAEKPGNYLAGFFGALVGGIVGMLIFWALFRVGFIASVSSLLGALVASWLYSRFGGKEGKAKVIIVAVVVFLSTAAAFVLCYALEVRTLMNEANIYGSALKMLGELLRADSQFRLSFWSDFSLSLVFSVVGIACVALSMVRQQRKISAGMKLH